MDEKCTNRSSPFSWEINPNPFCSLNHLTRPLDIAFTSFPLFWVSANESGRENEKSRHSFKSYAAFLIPDQNS
jgi:hypothetical protein